MGTALSKTKKYDVLFKVILTCYCSLCVSRIYDLHALCRLLLNSQPSAQYRPGVHSAWTLLVGSFD